ncbi:ABC transporter ATP-binding protein [Thermanaerothrix sp. 4228-RoL]|jgi:ABC-2 type transport system ATP-binding protein|uniref:ABC transporter ATP-binding protein n=1 Tax=Thermanaerothrix solaris TaxID=3058434 RepID=A0ABU3NJ28_9CHLR|nr:ABC transporter ATP-binding protein [Thermanaerothrix sp. 4228-RoL]MDT8896865.1 ABC transporter ATP-binding protein [Thermanaerothrix sp. 4228-RoL]
MSEVIVTKDLTKKYGDFVAVDHLNLTVRKGEVFGLLGPNGAGKTTTILMILGLTEPTSGSIRVLGYDPTRQPLTVKAHVGYLPDQVGFYDELTAYENLIYIAKLNGLSREEANRRIEEALRKVNLSEMRDKPVATFSRGMRQRLGVAEILIKQPQIIIMDEPTQGLDPEGAREFLDIIRNLRSEGITILLSSHLLHQVQAVCDRVGLFHRGKMMLVGTVDELGRKVLGKAFRIYLETPDITPAILEALKQIPGSVNVRPLNATMLEIEATSDIRHEAAKALIAAGGQLRGLSMEAQSLDEIYAQYFQEVEHVRA